MSVTEIRLKQTLIALAICLASATALILVLIFMDASVVRTTLLSIIVTMLTSAFLGLLYEFFLRKDLLQITESNKEEILDKLRLFKGGEDIGLAEIYYDGNMYDHTPMLLNSTNLTILLHDGRTWVSRHEADLSKRLADSSKKTVFVFVHPESHFLQSLSVKVGVTKERLIDKIEETIGTLQKLD